MKQQIQIPVDARKKGGLQSLRKTDKVPGVVYSPKVGSLPFSVELKNLYRYVGHAHENTIFTLTSSDGKLNNLKVLFKDKDIHPLTRKPTHIDFYAVDMTKTVRVNIDVKFTGKAAGVAEGGMFQAIRRTVEVECLPDSIPDFIEVDISALGVHDSIHVSDLTLPEGSKAVTDASVTLCTVVIIAEEEVAPVAAAAAGAVPEPELVGQKGKKEEGAEGAAAPAAGAKDAKAPAAPAAPKK